MATLFTHTHEPKGLLRFASPFCVESGTNFGGFIVDNIAINGPAGQYLQRLAVKASNLQKNQEDSIRILQLEWGRIIMQNFM